MKTKHSSLTITAAFLALLCAMPVKLRAATITVTSTADSGPGTLRAALASAASGDTIDVTGVSGTIPLTSGELLVSKSVTIHGPGPAALTVSGEYASRVFNVTGANVTIRGLTIAYGYGNLNGAGINAGGSPGSVIAVSDCVVNNNYSSTNGGGIFNSPGLAMTISNCTICGNYAGAVGGGIYNDHSTITVVASTLNNNSAWLVGGGIMNDGQSGGSSATLTISASTCSSNSAWTGGGIVNYGKSGSATLRINACTFSGNWNSAGGGAIHSYGSGGIATVDIGDTILNEGASGANIYNDSGTVTSDGYNLSSDGGSGFLTATNDQINTDPKLGPLQNNGGPTPTYALLPGSPAIDQGKRDAIPALARDSDQRGRTRPTDNPDIANATGGDGSDIGAFEVQSIVVTGTGDSGPGSLRQVIADAAGGDIIVITNAGTITLTSGELVIDRNLTIAGPGVASLAISGNNSSRVFNIGSGVVAGISGLTIRDGRSANGANGGSSGTPGEDGGQGGGIYNAGRLTLSDCIITNNRAGDGGNGIAGAQGGNGGFGANGGYGGNGGSGGAICSSSSGELWLDGCTISGNFSGQGGIGGAGGRGNDSTGTGYHGGTGGYGGNGGAGAGLLNAGSLTMSGCTVNANVNGAGGTGATGGNGGNCTSWPIPIHWGGDGWTGGAGGPGGSGGGIYGYQHTTLVNCTISGQANGQGGNGGRGGNGGSGSTTGNRGSGGNGGSGGGGGGIFDNGQLTLFSCTILLSTNGGGGSGGAVGSGTAGSATVGVAGSVGRGGGLYSGAQPPSVINTIVALNTKPASVPDDVFGDFASAGHNLIGNTNGSTGFGVNDDLLNVLPDLGPLADNGGPTFTHLQSSNSPAINAGCNTGAPETDQRGMSRIKGGTIDIGACEFQSPQSLICYAWLQHYNLPMDGSADCLDSDGDGQNNWQEWKADTSPVDANDFLHITSFTRSGTYNTLWWTSKPTRLYQVERCASLDGSSPWETIITNDVPGWNNVGFDNTGPQHFYRIRVVQP